MARLYTYVCDNCALSGHVAGGESRLMMGFNQTYYCSNCSNLFDAMTDSHIRDITPESISCNRCNSKAIIEWNDGEPCPKCQGNLRPDLNNGWISLAD